jgi:hypothetical protein
MFLSCCAKFICVNTKLSDIKIFLTIEELNGWVDLNALNEKT